MEHAYDGPSTRGGPVSAPLVAEHGYLRHVDCEVGS
jgi:hypothetical protein